MEYEFTSKYFDNQFSTILDHNLRNVIGFGGIKKIMTWKIVNFAAKTNNIKLLEFARREGYLGTIRDSVIENIRYASVETLDYVRRVVDFGFRDHEIEHIYRYCYDEDAPKLIRMGYIDAGLLRDGPIRLVAAIKKCLDRK